MTGYASKTIEITNQDGVTSYLTLSIKSLNSRFFEGLCKLPYPLQSLEVDLVTLFKHRLHRGKISFSIHSSNPNIFKGPIEPSLPTVESYLNAIDQIKDKFAISGELTISDIISLPNILIAEEIAADEIMIKKVMDASAELIDELEKIRTREGSTLLKDFQERSANLATHIIDIDGRAKKVFGERTHELSAKLEDLNHDQSEFAEIRRHQLTLDMEKGDINEEIVRFNSHLEALNHLLTSDTIEKGRRIEFIIQELGREINTIAAKCGDAQISAHAISVKVELEKIREQSQNIV